MGQCVLKDCGFEYQKVKVEKGTSFADFFKERIKPRSHVKEEKSENEAKNKEKSLEDPQETTKIHKILSPRYLDKKLRTINVHDDMIIDINHAKNQETSQLFDQSTPEKRLAFKKPEGKISELGSKPVINKSKAKVRRLITNMGRKLPSQNFTPLLDSLRDSLDKSPFQSKISLNEKYEKSSLFKAAQTNFQLTNNDMEQSDDENDMYDNIFSDGDSSVGGTRAQKTSGFFVPKADNIINVKPLHVKKMQ